MNCNNDGDHARALRYWHAVTLMGGIYHPPFSEPRLSSLISGADCSSSTRKYSNCALLNLRPNPPASFGNAILALFSLFNQTKDRHSLL
jgi:hypothetical protein